MVMACTSSTPASPWSHSSFCGMPNHSWNANGIRPPTPNSSLNDHTPISGGSAIGSITSTWQIPRPGKSHRVSRIARPVPSSPASTTVSSDTRMEPQIAFSCVSEVRNSRQASRENPSSTLGPAVMDRRAVAIIGPTT